MRKTKFDKAYDILNSYQGDNNQIRYWASLYKKNNFLLSSDFQAEYIIKNKDYHIQDINKITKITNELGVKLYEKYHLEFQPKVIQIIKIIGEYGNSIHCYIKYKQSKPSFLAWISKRDIVDDIFSVTDFENIEIDFDKYDNSTGTSGRKLKQHQKDAVKFMVSNKRCILADSMGLGKALSVNEVIPTPNGFIKMGSLRVGDTIFSGNGEQCVVEEIYEHPKHQLYTVSFNDGSSVKCGKEHLWVVKEDKLDKNDEFFEVKSLEDILKDGILHTDGTKSRFSIPVTGNVKSGTKKYKKIDMYKMGMIYGLNNISPHTKNFNEQNFTLNFFTTEEKNESVKISFDCINKSFFTNATYTQKTNYLRGLMDVNGYVDKKNRTIQYFCSNYQDARILKIIVDSLGGIAFIKEDNSVENAYIVNITLTICPFKHKTKKNFWKSRIKSKHEPERFIVSVEKCKELEDARCIKVNSEDETFLCTEEYIVTHNTTSAIIAAKETKAEKVLIITTASLKTNWKNELLLYEDEKNISIINGNEWVSTNKYTIINYDIIDNFYCIAEEPLYEIKNRYDNKGELIETLRVPVMIKDRNGNYVQKMKKSTKKEDIKEALRKSPLFLEKFGCVIIDEAHKLSNTKSNRYKVINDFLRTLKPEYIFLLTGTPITKNNMTLYNVLRLLDIPITRDYEYYITRYCGAKKMHLKNGKELLIPQGSTNVEELRDKIKHRYLRRMISDVPDMVKKEIITMNYDLTDKQHKEYEKLWEEYQESQITKNPYNNNEDYRQLIEGGLVRQFLAMAMIQNTIDLTDTLLAEDEKVVIICTYRNEMEKFKEYYKKNAVYFDGTMQPKAKDKAVDKFLHDKDTTVFIGQVIAAGLGINLTSASHLIFNSYDWNASNNKQVEDRIYRIVQTKDVQIIYQLFNDSISKDMYEKVLNKQILSDNVIKKESDK